MNANVMLERLIARAAEADLSSYERFRRIEPRALVDQIRYGYKRKPRVLANLDRDTPATAYGRVRRSKTLRGKLVESTAMLARAHPDHFLLWRAPYYDRELFDGLAFLSAAEPRLAFSFHAFGSGQRALDRWRKIGDALFELAEEWWPRRTSVGTLLKRPRDRFELQFRLWRFLYDDLIPLHVRRGDGERAWLVACKPGDYAELENETVTWSGRMEMAPGEKVYVYRMADTRAITDVFEVDGLPGIDPLARWRACNVDLRRVDSSGHLTFAEMMADEVLAQWGLVKSRFNGLVAESIPPRMRVRLHELLQGESPSETATPSVAAAAFDRIRRAGDYPDEDAFCKDCLEGVLKKMGGRSIREHACEFRLGSQRILGRIDYLVRDGEGRLLTIVEAKHSLVRREDWKDAAMQGRSYALQVGSASFIIAAPEGCRVFATYVDELKPALRLHGDEILPKADVLHETVCEIRDARDRRLGVAPLGV